MMFSLRTKINEVLSPKVSGVILWIWDFLIEQWFFIGLAVFVVLAYFYPNVARHGGHIAGQYSIGYGAVAIIFLQSGLSMKTTELMKNMGNWRGHLTVQITSFLISSAILYAFCCAVKSANNPNIDPWVLVGLIVTATCPTTVASNVVMTTKANGNALLCLCEVFIGNLLGAFISPALLQMYTSSTMFKFGNPASGSSIQQLYKDVMKQIGLSVFVPVFVGQVIQNVIPTQTEWVLKNFKLNKVSSFCLLLIMWSSFSTAFHQKAFTSIPHASVIFICFFNVGIYLFLTLICFVLSRPFFIPLIFPSVPTTDDSKFYRWGYKVFAPFYLSRADSIAVMFCGAAKTAALGVSLCTSQYGDSFEYLGRLLVPLVLYQSEQVITAQVLVKFFKKWEAYDHTDENQLTDEEKSSSAKSSGSNEQSQ